MDSITVTTTPTTANTIPASKVSQSLNVLHLISALDICIGLVKERFTKNIGITAVANDTNEPIIINILKSSGKATNTCLTSKAKNISKMQN